MLFGSVTVFRGSCGIFLCVGNGYGMRWNGLGGVLSQWMMVGLEYLIFLKVWLVVDDGMLNLVDKRNLEKFYIVF